MTTPNIAYLNNLTVKNAIQTVSTSGVPILTVPSGNSVRVNSLYLANINGSINADIVCYIDNGSEYGFIASGVVVPANASVVAIKKEHQIHLEENHSLLLKSSTSGDISAFLSYDLMS